MAQFRTLTSDDVRAVLAVFGAPAYRRHAPVAAGTINTNVRVETVGGALFLRINEGKTRQDVEHEAAIVSHAAAQGVPTPAPLRTPEGQPFVEWQGQLASLFPWVPGRTLSRAEVTPAHAALVGRALGALHVASVGFEDHGPGRYETDEIDRRLRGVAALAMGRPELAAAVAILAPELDSLERERVTGVPLGIIHGDLFIDNVLFDGGGSGDGASPRLAALIDFEQASWGRLAYDLAVTTLAFAYGRDDFHADVARALLEAYAAVRRPNERERLAFGAELRFAACRFAVTRITDVHLKRGAGAPGGKDFGRYLARLASVKGHLAARDGLLDLPAG
jgi:homoserine kinase type II